MPVEFSGQIYLNPGNEFNGRRGGAIDRGYFRRYVHALEDSDFDYTLVPYQSANHDPFTIASAILQQSERLKTIIALRPHTMYPTTAARQVATIDQLSGGRTAVHFIAGGDDHEQAREGDTLSKAQRYDREEEYIQIVRKAWSSREPFDHHGGYYNFDDFSSSVVPVSGTIPISVGGSSQEAYRVGGRLADIVGLWGEPIADTKQQIESIGEQAALAGRRDRPRPWIIFRPIIAPTEELAWEKAHRTVGALERNRGLQAGTPLTTGEAPPNVGSQRLAALTQRGERFGKALWTGTVTASSGASTSLVGTPETVAQALLDYIDIGVEIISLRAYDSLNDVFDYGRYIIPLVRQELAHRASQQPTGVAVA
jgi:alkanesulfonate monooxygenase